MGDLEFSTDVLGGAYASAAVALRDDAEGAAVAVLVRLRAAAPTSRAVLYVHGFSDYFFHRPLAEFWTGLGFDFYALDLRSYGRALLPHRTPNFTRSLAAYAEELDIAVAHIRADGHDTLVVNGHSTGGLTAALWAHHRPGAADALVLNSPFLELNVPPAVRVVGARAVASVAPRTPLREVPVDLGSGYGMSIHRAHHGEWDFDPAWKPVTGFPVRFGWIAAVHRGQQAVARGLEVRCPVLVLSSSRSADGRVWSEALHRADAVLDAERIARLAPRIGSHVTGVRIPDGMHDLALSGPAARERYYAETARWIGAYVP